MNASVLARHYHTLTAWERFPLLLAALTRGDDAEAERLAGSAPTRPALVPHYYGLWEGFTLLTVVHQTLQLERVCKLFATTGLMASGRLKGEEPLRRLRMLAFRFVVDADAWKLLSADLRIAPEAVLGRLPSCGLLNDMEEAARKIAFTPEEALAYLRAQPDAEGAGPAARDEDRIKTAAEVAQEMRGFLEERARRWP
jgi:hypothetical protein